MNTQKHPHIVGMGVDSCSWLTKPGVVTLTYFTLVLSENLV